MPRPIRTTYWAKPIPDRQWDWQAWWDSDEPDDEGRMACGFGRTEDEAIADLIENHGAENDAPITAIEAA